MTWVRSSGGRGRLLLLLATLLRLLLLGLILFALLLLGALLLAALFGLGLLLTLALWCHGGNVNLLFFSRFLFENDVDMVWRERDHTKKTKKFARRFSSLQNCKFKTAHTYNTYNRIPWIQPNNIQNMTPTINNTQNMTSTIDNNQNMTPTINKLTNVESNLKNIGCIRSRTLKNVKTIADLFNFNFCTQNWDCDGQTWQRNCVTLYKTKWKAIWYFNSWHLPEWCQLNSTKIRNQSIMKMKLIKSTCPSGIGLCLMQINVCTNTRASGTSTNQTQNSKIGLMNSDKLN